MADVDTDRLIPIVTGVQLNAELGDRPLAYRIEQHVREKLAELLPAAETGELPRLSPVVLSDVFYLNHEAVQSRPTISLGGPGVNALSALLVNELPMAVAIEKVLVIQMDLDMADQRVAVWGMNHLDTVRAVELFVSKGYLDTFVRGVVGKSSQ
jgi:hypothetical protein